MIPLDKLRAITHVVTHANCPDGVASALILKDALPNVRVSFLSYETAEHKALAAEPGLLFCDFSPPRDRVQEFVAAGAICLDHHPTARDVVEAFGENGVFGENEKNECGAWLAYEHVWFPLCPYTDEDGDAKDVESALAIQNVRWFAEYAAIRDTWKKDDPRWRAACEQAALLTFFPFDDLCLSSFGEDDNYHLLGRVLMDKQLAAARVSLDEAHWFMTPKGTDVLVFQGVSTTSDAAELAERDVEKTLHEQVGPSQPDLVVGFHYRQETTAARGSKYRDTLQFSMRSHTGYDVGAFAKSKGGGGHKAAAGFVVEVSPELSANPYAIFRNLLEEWEGGQ